MECCLFLVTSVLPVMSPKSLYLVHIRCVRIRSPLDPSTLDVELELISTKLINHLLFCLPSVTFYQGVLGSKGCSAVEKLLALVFNKPKQRSQPLLSLVEGIMLYPGLPCSPFIAGLMLGPNLAPFIGLDDFFQVLCCFFCGVSTCCGMFNFFLQTKPSPICQAGFWSAWFCCLSSRLAFSFASGFLLKKHFQTLALDLSSRSVDFTFMAVHHLLGCHGYTTYVWQY